MRKTESKPKEEIQHSDKYKALQRLFSDELLFLEYLMSFQDQDIVSLGRNGFESVIGNYIMKSLGWQNHDVYSWIVYPDEITLDMGKEHFKLPEWAKKIMHFSNSKVFDTPISAKEIKANFIG